MPDTYSRAEIDRKIVEVAIAANAGAARLYGDIAQEITEAMAAGERASDGRDKELARAMASALERIDARLSALEVKMGRTGDQPDSAHPVE